MNKMSVKTSILLPSLAVLIIGVIIMVITVSLISSSTTNDLTQSFVSAKVNEYSNEFKSLCLEPFGMVTALSPIIHNMKDMDNPRDEAISVMAELLMANDNVLGIWTCWEPNAFDGMDAEYAGAPYHDSTGRFIPYIYKEGNGYGIEALAGYDNPTDGEYYLGARNSGKPYITDPFEYSVGGTSTPLYSIAVPISENGTVKGVIGIDIKLETIISVMNEGSVLDTGYLFTLSPSGIISSHPNSDLVLQSYQTTWIKDYASDIDSILSKGGSFSVSAYSDVINANVQFLASGVMIADTGRYWAVCSVVPEKTVTASSTTLLWLVILIGFALITVSGLTILMRVRGRLRKLPAMTAMAETIARGDVNLADLDHGTEPTKNEITLLGRAFASMADSIKSQAEVMIQVSDGDYSVAVPVRSDADIMNKAIGNMLSRTNETMNEIRSSSEHVSNASKQIADGAQTLAHGSVEQAAAVQQLSASISEIAQKTKYNADMADRTSVLADTIKQNAEKGNRQMDEMMTAIKEINEASHSIGRVIKVVDDIAFQTNILALNAAVEAARAGQHGKGFAVVAEEVRNLAAKSSEAAKDTSELIANSVAKAELGTRIANETAASLLQIVSGINESNQMIGDIAKSSEEQSVGIDEINKGIDRVAQVVQQNSATAQQSAAASEEMNSQSAMLEDLISQFKLKDMKTSKSLPSASSSNGGYKAAKDEFGKY